MFPITTNNTPLYTSVLLGMSQQRCLVPGNHFTTNIDQVHLKIFRSTDHKDGKIFDG